MRSALTVDIISLEKESFMKKVTSAEREFTRYEKEKEVYYA